MDNQGWIKLYRSFLENPIMISGDSYLVQLWIYILLKVNHKEKRIIFNKKELIIKEGQGIFGLNQIVKDCTIYKNENTANFKRSKTIYYRKLKLLEMLENVKLQPTNKFTIVTVCNWNTYQSNETQMKLKRNSSETPVLTNKNDKNEKNEKNIIQAGPLQAEISLIIGLFSKVNPSYKRLFGNTTERKSADRLISQYGMDELTTILKNLPALVAQPYAPRITTPYELEKKMGQLKLFIQQHKKIIVKGGVENV